MAGTRKRREKLHAKNPHCHWCNVLTVLQPPGVVITRQPPNLATVDHLYSRFSGLKTGDGNKQVVTVLACYKCNQQRSEEEQARLGPEFCREHSDRVWNARCELEALGRILVGERKVYP